MQQHIAVYKRVSSRSQDAVSQEPDIDSWLKAYANGQPVKFYNDVFTGRTMDRPGFNRLEREITAGNVSTLVVWRLDRLGRTAKGLVPLLDDLRQRKINLVSIKDRLDLSTPAGALVANIIASVAAYETELRSERQMAGIAAAKARGVKFGCKPGMPRKSRIPDDKFRSIIEHHRAGWNISAISRAVGFSRKAVYAALSASEKQAAQEQA